MRELCLLKAKEENFLLVMDKQCQNGTDIGGSSAFNTRNPRLAISFTRSGNDISLGNIHDDWLGKVQVEYLRSFTMEFSYGRVSEEEIKRIFHGSKMLRVLSMELDFDDTYRCFQPLEEFRNNLTMGSLIHLRYLNLMSGRGRTTIPSSIGKLEHLQTLDVSSLDRVPNVLWKLKQLKHLYLPLYRLNSKLRVDGLHNLEILHNLHNRNTDVKSLSTLTNLRSLTAIISEKLEDLEEFMRRVSKLIYLRVLDLTIKDCDFCSEKGPTLLREVFSCSCLTGLAIDGGRISKLPEYELCFLPNLNWLILAGIANMEEDPMSTVEKLQNLRYLYLVNSFIGEEMICHASGFPQLETLKLENLKNLKRWLIEEGAMSNLSFLRIWQCKELKMIPDGLRFINTLNMPEYTLKRIVYFEYA